MEEPRRPPHIGSLNVGWQALEPLGFNLTVRYNGETLDNNFTGIGPSRVTLSEYTLVNLGAEYRLTDQHRSTGAWRTCSMRTTKRCTRTARPVVLAM